ncbi:hypothetical protein HBH53_112240 [Parastagonospora nodorum]|nr:hypothetical protein HBH53_112240 [Parastagonospora nodorum]KAH3969099.1 hypothetical protein HBH52_177530 [Parastagonospora nodorum]KAH4927485.1 hypothetical protein HBI79_138280 [Parastagonospora nodorum]KAH5370196.1 hypothetical protein HBI33_176520 [Parastagonospora nodorum]KAH6095016.1 hypothetical protein HBI65_119420 [Parastagonospora nodorum]
MELLLSNSQSFLGADALSHPQMCPLAVAANISARVSFRPSHSPHPHQTRTHRAGRHPVTLWQRFLRQKQ